MTDNTQLSKKRTFETANGTEVEPKKLKHSETKFLPNPAQLLLEGQDTTNNTQKDRMNEGKDSAQEEETKKILQRETAAILEIFGQVEDLPLERAPEERTVRVMCSENKKNDILKLCAQEGIAPTIQSHFTEKSAILEFESIEDANKLRTKWDSQIGRLLRIVCSKEISRGFIHHICYFSIYFDSEIYNLEKIKQTMDEVYRVNSTNVMLLREEELTTDTNENDPKKMRSAIISTDVNLEDACKILRNTQAISRPGIMFMSEGERFNTNNKDIFKLKFYGNVSGPGFRDLYRKMDEQVKVLGKLLAFAPWRGKNGGPENRGSVFVAGKDLKNLFIEKKEIKMGDRMICFKPLKKTPKKK